MKVSTLKRHIAKLEERHGNLDKHDVVIRDTNQYGVWSEYSVKQGRPYRHPFAVAGKLILEKGDFKL